MEMQDVTFDTLWREEDELVRLAQLRGRSLLELAQIAVACQCAAFAVRNDKDGLRVVAILGEVMREFQARDAERADD